MKNDHFAVHGNLWQIAAFFGLLMCPSSDMAAQCHRITAFDNQHFPCVDVSITYAGSVDYSSTPCNGLYIVGGFADGNITFTFSKPVANVQLTFEYISYGQFPGDPNIHEEHLSMEVNGVPTPFTSVGTPTCTPFLPTITPGGALTGFHVPIPGVYECSCRNINVQGPISSITIIDTHISGAPRGVGMDISFCCYPCIVNAGTINAAPLQLCGEATAIVPAATQINVPADMALQYLLFSNLNDTIGSILTRSNTPEFVFDPNTMQYGVPYYIIAVAGETVGADVDLSLFCKDFSNAVQVIWRPKPTVTFDALFPYACAGGCNDINVTFTGSPPFTLTYQAGANTITKVFYGFDGFIQICAPAGSSGTLFEIKALSLTDAHCSCN